MPLPTRLPVGVHVSVGVPVGVHVSVGVLVLRPRG